MLNNDYQKLRNCPSCGGKAEIKADYSQTCLGNPTYIVGCFNCCIAERSYFKNTAIEEWNRMVDNDKTIL